MSTGVTRIATPVTSIVGNAQSDVLAKDAVKFLHRRAPVESRLARSCTGCVSSGRVRPS